MNHSLSEALWGTHTWTVRKGRPTHPGLLWPGHIFLTGWKTVLTKARPIVMMAFLLLNSGQQAAGPAEPMPASLISEVTHSERDK